MNFGKINMINKDCILLLLLRFLILYLYFYGKIERVRQRQSATERENESLHKVGKNVCFLSANGIKLINLLIKKEFHIFLKGKCRMIK